MSWACVVTTETTEEGIAAFHVRTTGGESFWLTHGLLEDLEGKVWGTGTVLRAILHPPGGYGPELVTEFPIAYYQSVLGTEYWSLAAMVTYRPGHPPLVLRSEARPPSWPL
ncbi:MAG TPA: hypothetical protein VLK84_17600 [Longimicrobium sp.]|nr:hypothetical protein [Longimicrobium sp.]